MIVLIHVCLALASLIAGSYSYIRPAATPFRVTYGLVAATLVSGTYLSFRMPVHILHVCLSGLVYLASVTILLALAHKKVST